MTTTEAKPLTAKQQQVFDLLGEGVAIPAIAKRMNITRAGVYSHMRMIRAAGVTLPTERAESNGDSQPLATGDYTSEITTSGNGRDAVDSIIEDQIRVINEQESALQAEHTELVARVKQIEEVHQKNQAALSQHKDALAVYRR